MQTDAPLYYNDIFVTDPWYAYLGGCLRSHRASCYASDHGDWFGTDHTNCQDRRRGCILRGRCTFASNVVGFSSFESENFATGYCIAYGTSRSDVERFGYILPHSVHVICPSCFLEILHGPYEFHSYCDILNPGPVCCQNIASRVYTIDVPVRIMFVWIHVVQGMQTKILQSVFGAALMFTLKVCGQI